MKEEIYIPPEKKQQIIDDLRSDLRDFSDAYIIVKRTITVTNPDNNAYDKKISF